MGQSGSNRKVGVSWGGLGAEGLPCGARGKKSTRHGRSYLQAVTAVATGFLRPARRWSGPGLQNELRVPDSNCWEWMPRDGQAGLRPGPLDLSGSPGCRHCLWTLWGAEPGLDTENSKKALLSLELPGVRWPYAARPTPGGRLRASGAVTGSQSDCATWTGPGYRWGPAEAGVSAREDRGRWAVIASAAPVGTVSQTGQARPGESGWTEAS